MNDVDILGAGPAGLYAAILIKKTFPNVSVRVIERNPKGATFGFGVVFSDRALDFMQADAPELLALISPDMERWSDMRLSLQGVTVTLDGVGFSAVGRVQLLNRLQQCAHDLGVSVQYETELQDIGTLQADLIIGADGIQSRVREADPIAFSTNISHFNNRFAWFGAQVPFDTLTQTFIETSIGPLNAHHYRYSPEMSTFIVECNPETWQAYGFSQMSEAQSAACCSALFSETLKDTSLVTNRTQWRRFPRLWCDRWVSGNRVLIGDAAHSAHFSIGSGTRLAMEDSIALIKALVRNNVLEDALQDYQKTRQPIAKKIVDAANHSASWYDTFPTKMKLSPLEFAKDYLMRSGRIELDKLRKLSPRFMAQYDAAC